MSEKLIKLKLESPKFQDIHNSAEWTPELDEVLKKGVVTHCFNFNLVSLEINDEADRLGVRFGIANAYTNEKCRIRWFYLHCTRSLEQKKEEESQRKPSKKILKPQDDNLPSSSNGRIPGRKFEEDKKAPVNNYIKFKPTVSITPKKRPPVEIKEEAVPLDPPKSNSKISQNAAPKLEETKLEETKNDEPEVPEKAKDARKLWEEKEIREDKKESKTYAEAEQYQWRQNIIQTRAHKDYLDVSNENFSNYKTIDVQGNEITPSTFNIFRDSFKQTFTEIRDTLKSNLPDLNLEDVSESDENEDVVPLDFRTKLMGREGDVVMQAKPLKIYQSDEDDGELIGDILKKSKHNQEREFLNMTTEDFLREHKNDSFDENDESVVLINPNTNIKEKLNEIDLE